MKKYFSRELVRLYVFIFLALGFFVTTGIYCYQTKGINELFFTRDEGLAIDFTDGWIDEDGNVVNLRDLKYYDHEEKESYLFHRIIPEGLIGEESLCFEVRHMGFVIYFDDRAYDGYELGENPDDLYFEVNTISESDTADEFDANAFKHYIDYADKYGIDYIAYSCDGHGTGVGSRGAGTYLNTMQLYISDSGNTIYLELFPVYSSSHISNMMIEPANSYIRYRILEAFPKFIICLIIIVIGVAIIIVTFIVREDRSIKIYESLAALIILVGSWSLIESHLLDFILGSSEYLHTLSYYLLMGMAYPVAKFSDAVTLKPHKNIAGIVFVVSVALIVFNTIVNYLDIFDLHETGYLSDVLILLIGIFVIIRIIADQKFRKDNALHVNTNLISMSLAIITILGILDLLNYMGMININGIVDSSFFTRIGVMIFTIGVFINIFSEALSRNKQADKAGTYMEMAFTDALTGIPNRGAFLLKESEIADRMKESLKRKKDTNFQIVYVALDLNGLKIVNDTMGHATGDDYIVAAAGILMQAFSEHGYVYRVGGDEFASFIVGDDAVKKYEECIAKLIELVKEYNANSGLEMKMHIAYGYSAWNPGDTRSIHEIEQEGDEAMYEKKRQMKKEAVKNKD